GRAFDALPIGLEIVGLEKRRERAQQRLAVHLVLALARGKIVDERMIAYPALAVGCRDIEFLLDPIARDAGQLNEIAAIATLGELRHAPDTADAEQIRLVLIRPRMRSIGLD